MSVHLDTDRVIALLGADRALVDLLELINVEYRAAAVRAGRSELDADERSAAETMRDHHQEDAAAIAAARLVIGRTIRLSDVIA